MIVFFKSLFKAIGSFFKNIAKDPLGLLIGVVGAVISGGSLALLLGYTAFQGALVGAALSLLAYGADLPWLKMMLAFAGFAVGCYTNFFATTEELTRLFTGFGLDATKALKAIADWGFAGQLLRLGVSSFLLYSTVVEVRDGVLYTTALATSAEEWTEAFVGIVGGATTGLLSGLTSSPLGWLVIGAGIYLLYQWLHNDRTPSQVLIGEQKAPRPGEEATIHPEPLMATSAS